MTFKIQGTLPIKYTLAAHQSLPNYPTHLDFMFDVVSHIVRVAEQKGKAWDPRDVKFSVKTLNYVFGDNMKSDEFRARIIAILKDLIESGALVKNGDFIFIEDSEFSRYYTVS
jgi:hypothetical protein